MSLGNSVVLCLRVELGGGLESFPMNTKIFLSTEVKTIQTQRRYKT